MTGLLAPVPAVSHGHGKKKENPKRKAENRLGNASYVACTHTHTHTNVTHEPSDTDEQPSLAAQTATASGLALFSQARANQARKVAQSVNTIVFESCHAMFLEGRLWPCCPALCVRVWRPDLHSETPECGTRLESNRHPCLKIKIK